LARLDSITLDTANANLSHLQSFASHGYQKIVLRFGNPV